MRFLALLCLLCAALAIASPARADDEDEAARLRALALLRLAAPMPDADDVPTPPAKMQSACLADVPTARAKAAAESRPLLIWVGGCETVDKAVRGAFPDAVHCRCDSLNGSSDHRLLIPLQAGSYAVFNSEKLTKANVPDIRAVLERAPAKVPANVTQAVPAQSLGVRVYSAPAVVC